MSHPPLHPDPEGRTCASDDIALVIESRARDLGGFTVRRMLPSRHRRSVGPFVFLDHMGPASMEIGAGMDVRPHPHINLATVTYLFEGEILHRDSLGSNQRIQPGAINWMTAGRGIVHSERTPPERRAEGARLHGIQLWLALPKEHEETEPEFHHHPAATIPELTQGDVQIRVLAGSYAGATSPVRTFSPLFYVEARMPAGARLDVRPEHEERALYVGEGEVGCGDERARPGRIWILQPGRTVSVEASEPSRVMLLGGPPLDGERFMFWNFVSSRRERIEQAKRDWREDRFDEVPGDELERIPLPE